MTSPSDVLVERVWESDLLDSREEFALIAAGSGFELRGTTLIVHEGVRVEIGYRVDLTSDWSTLGATVEIPALAMDHWIDVPEPGIWLIDDEHRADLDGCTVIDLGWTPATNTIPIRSLQQDDRQEGTVNAAWLKWSELQFIPSQQAYTKTGEASWQYSSGDFTAELQVDDHGVVLRYGDPPIWFAEP